MIRVREAQPCDVEGIREVSVRNDFPDFNPEDMRRQWVNHPFRREFDGVPNAWVLENGENQIVGSLSNVHLLYEFGGTRIKAGITGSWCVDAPYRNSSMLLLSAYFKQKGVDLWLCGTAAVVTSRVMSAMNVPRIPSPDFDVSYFWITDRQAFSRAVLQKKKWPAALSKAVAAGLWTLDLRSRYLVSERIDVVQLSSFGPEFDCFWQRLRQGAARLRGVRTAASLSWRFGRTLAAGRAIVLALMKAQDIQGYVVLREFSRAHLGLRQYVIADLQALDDSPELLRQLLIAAIQATREKGLAALEWQGWNLPKREVALSLRPQSYQYPVWPLFYRSSTPDLGSSLENPNVWDFSLFDSF